MMFFASTVQSQSAPYRLDSGDIIEVSVFRRDDLRHRTTVDADGNIWLPLIGEVPVSGLTLQDLRTKVRELLATSDSVRSADVTVSIIEHRPFYIYGNVSKAGSYPYRARMTVRHAIALAGGLGSAGGASISPSASAELRGRHLEMMSEVIKYKVKIAGLQADLEDRTDFEMKFLAPEVLARPDVSQLIALEKDRLKSRQIEKDKERQYLAGALKLVDMQVTALERGQEADEEATKMALDEYQRVSELNRKGLAPTSRVTDEQQAAVLFKIRERDTAGRLALARQTREELRWRMEKAADQTVKIAEELREATASLNVAQARYNALSEQLSLSGNGSVGLDNAEIGAPEVYMYRTDSSGSQSRLVAKEDDLVEAGDVIEIKMKLNPMYSSLSGN
jgi:polysaccharide export outer membrane protein